MLEAILVAAKNITHADGGTLYRVTDERALKFEIMRNDTLKIAMGGTTGVEIPFYPIGLFDKEGKPVTTMVACYAVHHDESVNIADAYTQEGFDFSGTKNFDEKTGYRSQSFLTVPMKNHENEIIGVLQLINAKDPATNAVVPFSVADQHLAESLASQAAIALTNRLLIIHLQILFLYARRSAHERCDCRVCAKTAGLIWLSFFSSASAIRNGSDNCRSCGNELGQRIGISGNGRLRRICVGFLRRDRGLYRT